MAFNPFSLGNVLSQGENIGGARLRNQLARQQLDPNSRKNQLVDLQLEAARIANEKALNPDRLSAMQEIPNLPGYAGQQHPVSGQWSNMKELDDYKGSFTLGNNRYTAGGELIIRGEKDPEDLTKSEQKKFENTKKMRDEFVTSSKDFAKVNDAFARIDASAVDPSPAGDMALIFNYMKMLDPGSVVRESEFALAAQTGSFGERIQSLVSRISSGERLADSVRADFVDRSKRLFNRANVNYRKRRAEYERIAESFGLEPSQVIIDQAVSGTIDSGVQTSGGDKRVKIKF